MRVAFRGENEIGIKELDDCYNIIMLVGFTKIGRRMFKLHKEISGGYHWISITNTDGCFSKIGYPSIEAAINSAVNSLRPIEIHAFTGLEDFKKWLNEIEI